MKKLLTAIMLVLALNFIGVAGGVGWLWNSKHIDRDKVIAIKAILFPPASQPTTDTTTTQPAEVITPALQLEQLLAKQTGHSATEQIEFMQHTFDTQMAELDRRQRELADLKRQTDLAQEKLTRDHSAFEADRTALDVRAKEADVLASDKGFQDSLTLYNSMTSKQVKTVFMGLDDTTVMNYLRAMQPRTAAKIIKEFKTPDETARIERIMEQMRQSQPATAPSTPTAAVTP